MHICNKSIASQTLPAKSHVPSKDRHQILNVKMMSCVLLTCKQYQESLRLGILTVFRREDHKQDGKGHAWKHLGICNGERNEE